MTISNSTNRTSAVGSASAGQEVPFSFPVLDSSEVVVKTRVTADGTEATLEETTDYTVATNGDSGGTVTLVEALAATSEVWVIRSTSRTQSLDLEAGGSFSAEDVEDGLDKAVKLAIDNGDALDRSLRFPNTDPTDLDGEIDNSVDRADAVLGFDSNGAPESVPITTFGKSLLACEDAAAVIALLGL